jgi:hypothetical protein
MMQSDKGATGDQLWRALHALSAAVGGDQEQWEVVQTASRDANAHTSPTNVWRTLPQALLNRALAWHKAHPSSRPTVRKCGQHAAQLGVQRGGPEMSTTSWLLVLPVIIRGFYVGADA